MYRFLSKHNLNHVFKAYAINFESLYQRYVDSNVCLRLFVIFVVDQKPL